MPTVKQPTEIDERTATKADIKVYDKELDIYVIRKTKLKDNVKALYAVAWGQCSDAMKAKIKTSDKYEEERDANNISWLLKEIRGVTFGFESQRTLALSLQLARQDFYSFKQGSEMSLPTFYQTFKNKVAVLEHYSGGNTFGQDESLREAIRNTLQSTSNSTEVSEVSDELVAKMARGQALAQSFLCAADKHRYGPLRIELENQFARGNNQYPTDPASAYSLLVGYQTPQGMTPTTRRHVPDHNKNEEAPNTGHTFVQAEIPVAGTDGVTHAKIKCFTCNHKGHYSGFCPTDDKTNVQLLQATSGTDTIDDVKRKVAEIYFCAAPTHTHSKTLGFTQ
jgi:hypothetical protein